MSEDDILNYRDEICLTNFINLKRFAFMFFIACGAMFVMSTFIPVYNELTPAYALSFIVVSLFLLLIQNIENKGFSVAFYLYVMFLFLFAYTIYLSIVVSPEHMAATFLGLIAIVPLVILDKSWRVNLFVIVFVVIHTILAFMYKKGSIPFDDLGNSVILAVIGISMGASSRKMKLGNFELRRQALMLAYIDFLMGIYNRRKMYEYIIESEKGIHKIKGILLFDIDYFKGFNDNYGHQAGDDCLKTLGICLNKFGDEHKVLFFRYGGEEMIGFDYFRSYSELSELSESLRKEVLALNVPYPDSEIGRVSVSVGFATQSEEDPVSIENLISLADQAVYRAKSNGRNCCIGVPNIIKT